MASSLVKKNVNDLLKKFIMNEAKIVTTLMNPPLYIDRDENGKYVFEKGFICMIE